jgi:hypothetical protein
MEATFDINEETLEVLRLEAERNGITMSALVELALQMALPQGLLNQPKTEPPPNPVRKPLPPLPTWRAEFLVDVSNREELYRVLDDSPKFRKLYGFTPNSVPKERE